MSPWLRFWRLLTPYRWTCVLAAALAGLACLFNLAGPLIIERLLRTGRVALSPDALSLPAAILLAAVVVQSLASGGNSWLLGRVAIHLVRDLRHRIYERLMHTPLAWFDRTPTGAVMTRLMDDVAVVQGLASGQTLMILIDVSTAVGAALWLGTRSWRLFAVLGVLAPLYVVIFRLFTRRIRRGTDEVRRELDLLFSRLKQKIDGVSVIRATANEPREVAEFTQQITALHHPRVRVNQLGIAFSNLCVGVGSCGAVLVFAVGALEVGAGRITTGELIVAAGLAGLLFTPITRLSELATLYQQASASLSRISEILDYPAAALKSDRLAPRDECLARSRPALPAPVAAVGRVEFDRVQFRYVADRPTLKGISLSVEPGQKIAVVGPTGSGKTTLINLLLRFYEPSSGEVRIDGRPLADIPASELRRMIGLVPQDAVVFRGSLADNLRYGTPRASDAEVETAARAALVEDFARKLPQQYASLVGEGGHPLSQGERQRIAIARLFCKNPAIVLLDEATSSLDRFSEIRVQQALDRLLAGRTTLIIAHRLATVLAADQIVVMDQGRVVQVGTHAELLGDEVGLYRQLYDCQFAPLALHPSGPRVPDPDRPATAIPLLEPVAA